MIVFGGDYEHTIEVSAAPGVLNLEYRVASRPELFAKVLHQETFDACEFSLSNYIMLRDAGDDWLTAVAVFPARSFRHGTVLVRRDDTIEHFRDLAGRRIGIPDYTMTAGVWCRGILADEYGLHWSAVRWFSTPTPRITPPVEAEVQPFHGDLEDALADGTLDAAILPRTREASRPSAEQRFRPLMRAWWTAEADYFARTGLFPISHVVVLAKAAIEANPKLPEIVTAAYGHAMARAKSRRLATTFLPWGEEAWRRAMHLFDDDPMPYGLGARNRRVVQKLQEYLVEQQLIRRPHALSDLFVGGDGRAVGP